uniref:Uncharacterized protein n=1 Tax=Chromera velia CCMP2878 TaxID=1169474 RepID=A0A0G4GF84_9ALVE|eukprot:Cvel_21527.t1-p1 / transcript=Cvel_21527.t1 / gene=Cvel_21527 / organism=Chromera_velia_CCMP2878 / gene_product=hypothetical protein / transcript_product=hypothetical protein / location=Cvel_scaffold2027:13633-14256(-) / protein_length=208 / sequence_SO=supercontig / SO=protein_coding / is_pseudo=false
MLGSASSVRMPDQDEGPPDGHSGLTGPRQMRCSGGHVFRDKTDFLHSVVSSSKSAAKARSDERITSRRRRKPRSKANQWRTLSLHQMLLESLRSSQKRACFHVRESHRPRRLLGQVLFTERETGTATISDAVEICESSEGGREIYKPIEDSVILSVNKIVGVQLPDGQDPAQLLFNHVIEVEQGERKKRHSVAKEKEREKAPPTIQYW